MLVELELVHCYVSPVWHPDAPHRRIAICITTTWTVGNGELGSPCAGSTDCGSLFTSDSYVIPADNSTWLRTSYNMLSFRWPAALLASSPSALMAARLRAAKARPPWRVTWHQPRQTGVQSRSCSPNTPLLSEDPSCQSPTSSVSHPLPWLGERFYDDAVQSRTVV